MSYELAITPEAEQDLARLIDSLPPKRRGVALDAALAELEKLASNPGLAVKSTVGRPTYRFSFVADRIRYHWAALFKYSTDEKAIVVTQLFRVPL
jgi:plasmid stabilization system protein ParE